MNKREPIDKERDAKMTDAEFLERASRAMDKLGWPEWEDEWHLHRIMRQEGYGIYVIEWLTTHDNGDADWYIDAKESSTHVAACIVECWLRRKIEAEQIFIEPEYDTPNAYAVRCLDSMLDGDGIFKTTGEYERFACPRSALLAAAATIGKDKA